MTFEFSLRETDIAISTQNKQYINLQDDWHHSNFSFIQIVQ